MSRFVHDSQNTMAPVCPFTSTKNAMLKIWILSALGPLETVNSFQREISTPDLRRQPWMLWVFGVFHWLQSSCLMTVKCPQSLFWRCLFLMCYHSSHVYRYDCCYHDCHSCHYVFFLETTCFRFACPFSLCCCLFWLCFIINPPFVHVVRWRNSAMKPNANMFLQGGYIFYMCWGPRYIFSLKLR